MSSGIYLRTKKHNENIRKARMGKPSNAKGKHWSEESKQNIKGKSNAEGKHWNWSEESKLKIIGNQNFHPLGRSYKRTKEHQENINKSRAGYRPTEETKQKHREAAIKYLQYHHQKTNGTLPEKIMECIIKEWIGYKIFSNYKKQFRIGKYLVDFLLDNYLIIEVYGKHWHSGFAKKYKDMKRKETLEKLGFEIKIFWAKEIFKFRKSSGEKYLN